MPQSHSSRASWVGLAQLALVSSLASCVLQSGGTPISAPDDENLAADDGQGLSAYTREFAWKRGNRSSTRMLRSAGSVCFLTGVHGTFRGKTEMVKVSNVRGYWYVTGIANQPDVGATARCFKYDSAKVVATQFNESARGEDLDLGVHRFCALSRVSGNFQSAADEVKIYPGKDGHWFLQTRATSSGVNGGALCLDDDPATPHLHASRIADVHAGETQVIAVNLIRNEAKTSEPLRGPACFLTSMAGNFASEGGNVQTFVAASANGTWNYYLRATGSEPGVASSGVCLR